MKQPLNYAILLYFTNHEEGDADTVVEELSPDYGRYRAFSRKGAVEALMTSKENGILEEVRTELHGEDSLRVWYRLTGYGKELIDRFL
ncbi:MAG: hypothetical protein FWF33_06685 [Clostridiales bacterium]|nr:hypothetical protein [Clostridiales bacterium]